MGALAVVNAFGSPVDRVTGGLLGAAFVPPGLRRPPTPPAHRVAHIAQLLAAPSPDRAPAANTTLAVVATNAPLDPAWTSRTATAAHAGLARALDPVHTLLDGDTVFALATGEIPIAPEAVSPCRRWRRRSSPWPSWTPC